MQSRSSSKLAIEMPKSLAFRAAGSARTATATLCTLPSVSIGCDSALLVRRWRDESTHGPFDPLTLIKRLRAWIPDPRQKCVRTTGSPPPALQPQRRRPLRLLGLPITRPIVTPARRAPAAVWPSFRHSATSMLRTASREVTPIPMCSRPTVDRRADHRSRGHRPPSGTAPRCHAMVSNRVERVVCVIRASRRRTGCGRAAKLPHLPLLTPGELNRCDSLSCS